MNVAERRLPLTTLVAVLTVLVVGAVIAGERQLGIFVDGLPDLGSSAVVGFIGLVVVLLGVVASVRLATLARCRARRNALEASFDGRVECGVRHAGLDAALAELPGRRVTLAHRFSIVADQHGLSFWSGGGRPRRTSEIAWREVRSMRAGGVIAGSRAVPTIEVRVRRGGASVSVPIILGTERPGSFAVTDAPFYAVLRSWKALHRTALELEGLELPPLTAPIPVITAAMLAAAR